MHFPHLRGEDRQDARANALGLAWVFATRLVEAGKVDHSNVNYWMDRCIWYGVRQTWVGRTPQSSAVRDDVFDRLHRNPLGSDDVLLSFASDSTPIPEQVSWRVDVMEDFMGTLSPRHRTIIQAMMQGYKTGELAHIFGVSPGRISQFRLEFRLLMDKFFDR